MKNKNPVGRPKTNHPKLHIGLRLSCDVIAIIRSKPSQVKYIEELVRQDKSNNGVTIAKV